MMNPSYRSARFSTTACGLIACTYRSHSVMCLPDFHYRYNDLKYHQGHRRLELNNRTIAENLI